MFPNFLLCLNEGGHKSLGGLLATSWRKAQTLIREKQKCTPSYKVIGLVAIQIKGIRKAH